MNTEPGDKPPGSKQAVPSKAKVKPKASTSKTSKGDGWQGWLVAIAFFLVSMGLGVAAVVRAGADDATTWESSLWQVLFWATSICWSGWFGYLSARRAGKPHARSAVRRILSLYKSLARMRTRVAAAPTLYRIDGESLHALWLVDAMLEEQLATVDDAMRDWEDMITAEEIRELATPFDDDSKETGKDTNA